MDTPVTYYKSNKINPHKFALWAAMASITMMFSAFISFYIVRYAAGNWLEFKFPPVFYGSTVSILATSVFLHFSLRAFRAHKAGQHKMFLWLSFSMGMLFVVLQILGWNDLFEKGVDLKGNVSGAFFYLISGVHAVHVLGGVAALIVALIHTYSLKFKPTYKRISRFELVVQYGHFIDFIWVYLFLFLLIYK